MNAEDLCGTVLGTCTLQKVIGRGGVGAVFLAQQSRPRRQVAVKVLLPITELQPGQHKAFLNRFRRETDAAASLDHPNIMPVHEYGEREGLAYLVMPYISGGTLRDELEAEGRLPLLRIVLYLEQIAAALDHAHERGVIHRDIKPANILMTPEKRLLLTDFGLVKIITDGAPPSNPLSEIGMPMGTPDYMSPEQVVGKKIDTRADIYSLGVLVYHMVTGTVPFKGDIPMKVALQHLQAPPPLPHTMRPDLPSAAEQVILRALAKKPDDRYACARDMASAFRLALEAAGVQMDTNFSNNEERSGNRKRGLFDPLWRNSLQVPLQEPDDTSTQYNTTAKQPLVRPTIAPDAGTATKATRATGFSKEATRSDIIAQTKITLPSFSGILVDGAIPTIATTTQLGQGGESMSLLPSDQDLMAQGLKTREEAAKPATPTARYTPLPAVPDTNNDKNISMAGEEFPPFVQFLQSDQNKVAEEETPRHGDIIAPRLRMGIRQKANLQGLGLRRHEQDVPATIASDEQLLAPVTIAGPQPGPQEQKEQLVPQLDFTKSFKAPLVSILPDIPETSAMSQPGNTGELTPTGTASVLNKPGALNKQKTPDDLDSVFGQYRGAINASRINQAVKKIRTPLMGKSEKAPMDIRSALDAGQKGALQLLEIGILLNARMKQKTKIMLLVALGLLIALIIGIFALVHAHSNNHPTGLAHPASTSNTTANVTLSTQKVGKAYQGIDQQSIFTVIAKNGTCTVKVSEIMTKME
jgi:serine/threonine protein kinase